MPHDGSAVTADGSGKSDFSSLHKTDFKVEIVSDINRGKQSKPTRVTISYQLLAIHPIDQIRLFNIFILIIPVLFVLYASKDHQEHQSQHG